MVNVHAKIKEDCINDLNWFLRNENLKLVEIDAENFVEKYISAEIDAENMVDIDDNPIVGYKRTDNSFNIEFLGSDKSDIMNIKITVNSDDDE